MVDMIKKFSTHVDSLGYDDARNELHVTYRNGRTAVYKNVPPDIAGQVTGAASVGSALHDLVKGRYEFFYR